MLPRRQVLILAAVAGCGQSAQQASETSSDSLLAAKSLAKSQRDSLYRRMFSHVDLNRGTDAEFLLIPGAGQRMLREFKEYRPWTSFEQFQREIGKYVRSTPGEVERLEQYVFMPIELNTFADSTMATFAPWRLSSPTPHCVTRRVGWGPSGLGGLLVFWPAPSAGAATGRAG